MATAEINGNGVPHTNGTVPTMNGAVSYAAKHNLADHFIGGNKLENAAAGPVKDFVASHDGHTVISSVSADEEHSWQRRAVKQLDLTNCCKNRFSLQITALRRSKRSDQCENGHTRPLAMRELFNLLLWRRPRIYKQTQITFGWLINMLRYREVPIIIIMQTSN
jgi:hypothetical protein